MRTWTLQILFGAIVCLLAIANVVLAEPSEACHQVLKWDYINGKFQNPVPTCVRGDCAVECVDPMNLPGGYKSCECPGDTGDAECNLRYKLTPLGGGAYNIALGCRIAVCTGGKDCQQHGLA